MKMHCNALAANNIIQQQTEPFRRCRGMMGVYSGNLRAVYVWKSVFDLAVVVVVVVVVVVRGT